MSVTAREAAYLALAAYEKRGARPDMVLSQEAAKGELSRRDTSLAYNITNGVLQNRGLIDYYIRAFSGRGVDELQLSVALLLRIAVYQMVFLEKIPAHAAVSESVELSKKYTPRASGLVNAVLRKAASSRHRLPDIVAPDRETELSIRFSHPKWLVHAIAADYGEETCEEILKANNTPVPVTAMVNTLRFSVDAVRESLKEDGAAAVEHTIFGDALFISGSGAVAGLKAYSDGGIYIQDAAARMAVIAAGPKAGDTVMDVCAAPGGKSFAAAIMMGNKGRIIASDVHEKKLGLISSGAERLGIDIVDTLCRDGREPDETLTASADVVVTDVPCSGMGVIRKKPEIRYKPESELARLPEIQLAILKNAANHVRPGGVLLYSTCTILKRENEGVISAFLEENSDFSPEGFTLPEPFGFQEGMITILPHIAGTDGFFICKMRRKK